MITDKPSFKILQIHSDKVICMTANGFKFIYRDYPNSQSIIHHLHQFQSLTHPSLIHLKTINVAQNVGVYFEHFSGNLTKYMGSDSQEFQESQIVNTFSSVVQVIEYMIGQGFMPSIPKLQNIVITEQQQIKFANDILITQNENCISLLQNKPTSHQIYEGLSNLIFQLAFRKVKNITKSWKSKLKLLKKYFSSKNYAFFLTIYNKSLLNNSDPSKTKKIVKKSKIEMNRRQIKLISQKNHKTIKNRLIPSSTNHQGKENQISQQ